MSWSKERAKEEYEANLLFLRNLQVIKSDQLKNDVLQAHKNAFEEINCLSCANCCKSSPPIVTRKDAKRMGKALGIPPKTFIKKYLIHDIDGSMMMNGVPCTFLQEDNTCTIYHDRPQACRAYPHTDDPNYLNKPRFNVENTVVCPAAYAVVKMLETSVKKEES